MSTNPRDDERLAQISGVGIGPKNILITFSFPITRTSSCIMQYMAMRTNRMIWIAQKCGQMISAKQLSIARNKAARRPPEIDKTLHIVNESSHQPVD